MSPAAANHAAENSPATSRRTGRLIVDAAASGAWNMAVDQTLLEDVDAGGPTTLRFYAWDEPTLSLGYFQSAAERNAHRESLAAAVVRRATGGGAILHDQELTYSLCMPIADRASRHVRAVYDAVHQAIIAALADFGVAVRRFADSADPLPAGPEPFLCFQRRTDEDLMLAGYKVAGSAQRRSARAVLQHGSLILAASPAAPQLPGITQLTSKQLAPAALADRIAHHIGVHWGIRWERSSLPAEADQRSRQVVDQRFATQAWTQRR